jgi:hypothetical protein
MLWSAANTDAYANGWPNAHSDTDANLHANRDVRRGGLPHRFAVLWYRDQRPARYNYGILQRAGHLRFSG